MTKEVDLKFVQAIDTGEWDILALRGNLDDLEEAVNEHATELRALAFKQTQTISFAIEEAGLTTILHTNKHLRCKIVNAFIQLGDNIKIDDIVTIQDISDSIRFAETEKAGKVRIFNILKSHLMFNDELIINTTSNRRVIVNVTIESTEVGN